MDDVARSGLRKVLRRASRVLPVVALVSMTGGVGVAAAAPVEAAPEPTSGPVQVQSNPPGECMLYELGTVKLGPDGYLYECTYIHPECWYWIPV